MQASTCSRYSLDTKFTTSGRATLGYAGDRLLLPIMQSQHRRLVALSCGYIFTRLPLMSFKNKNAAFKNKNAAFKRDLKSQPSNERRPVQIRRCTQWLTQREPRRVMAAGLGLNKDAWVRIRASHLLPGWPSQVIVSASVSLLLT